MCYFCNYNHLPNENKTKWNLKLRKIKWFLKVTQQVDGSTKTQTKFVSLDSLSFLCKLLFFKINITNLHLYYNCVCWRISRRQWSCILQNGHFLIIKEKWQMIMHLTELLVLSKYTQTSSGMWFLLTCPVIILPVTYWPCHCCKNRHSWWQLESPSPFQLNG